LRPGPGKNAVQQRALRVLKQKKMYEDQLTQLTQQSFNMENAAMMTENLRNTMATVNAMQVANKEMRKQYGKIDLDKIEVRFVYPLQRSTDINLNFRTYIMRWRI
jgi:charged multivesicular body protein 5